MDSFIHCESIYIYIYTYFLTYFYTLSIFDKNYNETNLYIYIYMYVICIFVFNPIFQLILIGSLLQNFSIPLEISNIITLANVLASFS